MKNEQGIALVIVLWTVMMLTVIAGNFVFAMRTETTVAHNAVSAARAEAAADGAIHRALYETMNTGQEGGAWQADGRTREWESGSAKIKTVMMDQSGKIDINTGAEALLNGLLLSAGADEDKAAQLRDAILDWRDTDDLAHPNGAEADAYSAAGLKYQPSNAPFDAVEQLQQVMGMTPEIYTRIEPLVTVYSLQTGINPLVAPKGVLLAIPGADPAGVDAYIAQREQALQSGQTPPQFPPAAPYTSTGTGAVIDVRAEVLMDDGAVFVREASARVGANPERPVAFLSWKEGRPAPIPEEQN